MGFPNTPEPVSLTDHWWWRPGWRPGRRMWTWHVTFGGDHGAELHALAAAHATLLAVPGLDVVPERWLHLTVQGLGFTDEVDDDAVAAVVASARCRLALVDPAAVELGPAQVRGSRVFLPVRPAVALVALRAQLRAAVADVLGPAGVPGGDDEGFRPHVSLAYSDRAWDASAVVAALARVAPATAGVLVAEAQLIRLGRDEHLYRWDAVHRVPLGAASVSDPGAASGR